MSQQGRQQDQNGSPDDSEQMCYAVAGGDEPSVGESLEKYTGEVGWDYLKPHFDAGVMLFVDPQLSLIEVGEAVSADDSARVEGWLKTGDLLKPGDLHAQHWAQVEQKFTALVVSPFVLAQPSHSDG